MFDNFPNYKEKINARSFQTYKTTSKYYNKDNFFKGAPQAAAHKCFTKNYSGKLRKTRKTLVSKSLIKKVQAYSLQLYWKRDSGTDVFQRIFYRMLLVFYKLAFLKIFRKKIITKHLLWNSFLEKVYWTGTLLLFFQWNLKSFSK